MHNDVDALFLLTYLQLQSRTWGRHWNDHWEALRYQKQDKWEKRQKMAAKGDRRMEGAGVMGWRRWTEIQLACILLPIQTTPFHLRAHQLLNWESDGDVRAARISTRREVGAPLSPNQNTITGTARTRFLLQHTFFLKTQTLLDKCTCNHAHTEKYINLKSHMDKHIRSRAIALRPISNYPQHRGREMMYKTQFNISYLWLWHMTWVYLHYTVAHSKSFTLVGDYWRERRKGSNCGCIYGPMVRWFKGFSGSVQAFLPNAPNHRTSSFAMVESSHPTSCNIIQLPGQHSLL